MTAGRRLPGGASLDLERRLSYRLSLLSSRMMRHTAAAYGRKHGLLVSGWKAMSVIGRYGRVSATEVSVRTTVMPDKVTRAVDRLVELGYVRRGRDAEDGRRVVLTLTAAGQRVYEQIERLARQVEATILGALGARERKTLAGILDKLEARARAKGIGDRPPRRGRGSGRDPLD